MVYTFSPRRVKIFAVEEDENVRIWHISSKKKDFLHFLAQFEPIIQIFFVILHRFNNWVYEDSSRNTSIFAFSPVLFA